MQIKKIIIPLCFIVLQSCTQENDYIIYIVSQCLHKNIGELVMRIGTPDTSISTQNANYYTWTKQAKKAGQVHGYHYKDPLTYFISNNMMQNLFEQEPQEIIYECKLTIGTNKKDIITIYNVSGKCNKRNTFFKKILLKRS
jgi:hypothetical protein